MDERFWDTITEHGADPLALEACRALVEHTRDVVLLVTEEGDIVLANAAAEIAYGRSRAELHTTNIRDLRAEGTRDTVGEQMRAAAGSGTLFETNHLRSDGSSFPVEVSCRNVQVGGSPHLLSIIRDISARRSRDAERENLLADLEQANRQLEGLLRLVSSTVGHTDVKQLFDDVLDTLRDVMHAEAALLFVFEADRWVLRAQHGYEQRRVEGFTMRPGEGFASTVADAGVVVWVANVTETPSHIPAHDEFGVRSMFGIPLYVGGELYGVLECAWSTERLVSDAERVMLTVASDRIMAAIAGAQKFAGASRERGLEWALAEATAMLASSHDAERTVPGALGIMARALGCDVAAFGDYERGRFRIVCGVGIEPRVVEVPEHQAHAGPAEPVYRVHGRSPHAPWLRDTLGLVEAVVVPVNARGDLMSAVVFGVTEDGGDLDEFAAEYATRLSASMALAYANARDYEAEHHIAQTLQEALLTLDGTVRGIDFGHVYRSATQTTRVGGDFYDVFSLGGGLAGVLVGDVSGKGLDAAVLTMLVKHTVRAFAHECVSPAEILRRANEALAGASRLRDFASVALLVVDPRTGQGRYCGAGHPPALITRASGGVDVLACGSPVIGAFSGLPFVECPVRLERGDVAVLYTDGVTEARSPDGEFFGDERLVETIEILRGADVVSVARGIEESVTSFAGGSLSDDIAVVAFTLA